MHKSFWRRERLQQRKTYSPAERTARSERICRQFFAYFDLRSVQTLHVFLPLTAQNEVDTWPIIAHLRRYFPAITIAVPVTHFASRTLTHHLITPETTFINNQWGIPEPLAAAPVTETALDLVLVPLLAFDGHGHRVGYGHGFYDRFLAACRPDAITVGLAFEEPIPLITDVHAGDVALQFVVTPEKVYRFMQG